jgi:hypothetical protein
VETLVGPASGLQPARKPEVVCATGNNLALSKIRGWAAGTVPREQPGLIQIRASCTAARRHCAVCIVTDGGRTWECD